MPRNGRSANRCGQQGKGRNTGGAQGLGESQRGRGRASGQIQSPGNGRGGFSGSLQDGVRRMGRGMQRFLRLRKRDGSCLKDNG